MQSCLVHGGLFKAFQWAGSMFAEHGPKHKRLMEACAENDESPSEGLLEENAKLEQEVVSGGTFSAAGGDARNGVSHARKCALLRLELRSGTVAFRNHHAE